MARKVDREVDRVHGRGFLERETGRVGARYNFRIYQSFIGESEKAGSFAVRDGTIELDEPDSMNMLSAQNKRESRKLVLSSGLSLDFFVVSGDPMTGTTWSIILTGDSIGKLLEERGLR